MNKNKLSSLSILIPCYNDASTIENLVLESVNVAGECAQKYEIIVINDKSTDETLDVLMALTKKISVLTVINHTINKGYGGTIKELYYKASSEWQFSVPGDFQIDPHEVMKLISYSDRADMILGWRVDRHDPPERLRQSRIYNGILRFLFDLPTRDVNSVRLMRSEIFKKIHLKTTSAFVDAELVISAFGEGFRVIEVPIGHKKREGSVGGGGRWGTIGPTIVDMVKFWVSHV